MIITPLVNAKVAIDNNTLDLKENIEHPIIFWLKVVLHVLICCLLTFMVYKCVQMEVREWMGK